MTGDCETMENGFLVFCGPSCKPSSPFCATCPQSTRRCRVVAMLWDTKWAGGIGREEEGAEGEMQSHSRVRPTRRRDRQAGSEWDLSRKMRYFVEWPKLPFSPTKFDAEMGSFGILVFVFLLPAWIKLP